MSAPAAAADSSEPTADSGSSGFKRGFPGAANVDERRMQPRHFHAGPSPAAAAASSSGDDAAAAESDHPPPATAACLYRHALESIFAFLHHRELVTALRVSHSWLAAVNSMASLQLTVTLPSAPLCVVADSVMGRHVIRLGGHGGYVLMTADSLFIVTRLMPQLRGLICDLELPATPSPLTFPLGLQKLDLRFTARPAAADVNATLEVISRLPLLEVFVIRLDDFDERISFAPLASLPLLRDLEIHQLADDNAQPAVLSNAQVAQLRALPHLKRLEVRPMTTSQLRRLLAQPHDLQWQGIRLPDPLDDEAAVILPQLPSLTSLQPHSAMTCTRFDFLRRLPNLANVRLKVSDPSPAGCIESLVAEMQSCTKIEELELISPELTVAHLAELLPRLPRLHTLEFCMLHVDCLSFLAQGPMTQQLISLTLFLCRLLPLTELRHVHALKSLKKLYVIESFDVPMDPLSQSLFTPPSLLMPQLDEFTYEQP